MAAEDYADGYHDEGSYEHCGAGALRRRRRSVLGVVVGVTHWASADGRFWTVEEMDISHIANVLSLLSRRAQTLMLAKANVLASAGKEARAMKLLEDSDNQVAQFKFAAKRYPILWRMTKRLEAEGVQW